MNYDLPTAAKLNKENVLEVMEFIFILLIILYLICVSIFYCTSTHTNTHNETYAVVIIK